MTKLLKLVPTIIEGVIKAAYNLDGVTYGASDIEQRQSVVINGFTANTPKRVDLFGLLKTDLLVTSLIADVVGDDTQALTMANNTPITQYNYGSANIVVHIIDRKTNKLLAPLVFPLSPTFVLTNENILSSDYIYDVISSVNLNRLIVRGKPIYQLDPVVT